MKKKVLFSIALAGLMLGSCSKDVIDNGGSNKPSWNENGEGYISLSLNLPTVSGGSRANPTFADGEGKEYAVNDAILVLFVGENETDAMFNSAYNMDLGNWENKEDQITTSARIVQKIKEIENTGEGSSNNIYALVVLNNNGILSVDAKNRLSVNGSNFTGKLSQLNKAVADIINSDNNVWNATDKGFLMSNSPLFSAKGGGTQPSGNSSTLVEIKGEIYPTAEEAFAKPSASIYVERAQAKIQVNHDSSDDGNFTITDKDGNTVTYKYTFDKWDIDNYNKQSYLTRLFNDEWAGYTNASTTTFYRFVDASPVEDGAGYRTYWGTDVNYAAITTANTANPALQVVSNDVNNKTVPDLKKSMGEYKYCFENTTAAVPATGLDLTRVIISAKLKKGDNSVADFFIVNGDRSEMYLYDDEASDGSIQKRIKAYVLADQGVQEKIAESISAGSSFTDENLTVTLNISDNNSGILNNRDDITVDLKDAGNIGIEGEEKTTIEKAIKDALYAADDSGVENKINFDYYKGGVCYYQAFIRHFTESECPWTKGVDQSDESTKYLGRYGVLRNNWYVLNVKSISGIGDSTYPELPEEPIDKEEFYISVDINILAWAKREQDVDL